MLSTYSICAWNLPHCPLHFQSSLDHHHQLQDRHQTDGVTSTATMHNLSRMVPVQPEPWRQKESTRNLRCNGKIAPFILDIPLGEVDCWSKHQPFESYLISTDQALGILQALHKATSTVLLTTPTRRILPRATVSLSCKLASRTTSPWPQTHRTCTRSKLDDAWPVLTCHS